jgi:hypothetical protein
MVDAIVDALGHLGKRVLAGLLRRIDFSLFRKEPKYRILLMEKQRVSECWRRVYLLRLTELSRAGSMNI